MILVLWLARLLRWGVRILSRAEDAVYRVYYRHENRKAVRKARRLRAEQKQRDAVAIEDVIAETRPVSRVRAPIHRDR